MPKYIGETNENFENGNVYHLHVAPFTGKIYKPGKDESGDWIDKIGVPDVRIAIYFGDNSKVYENEEAYRKDWDDGQLPLRRNNKIEKPKRTKVKK